MSSPCKIVTGRAEFIRLLKELARGKKVSTVFEDFCNLGAASLAAHTAFNAGQRSRHKEAIVGILKLYDDPSFAESKMVELFGLGRDATAQGGSDFLGDVAAEVGALDGWMGQFFTPYELSKLSASLTLTGCEKILAERDFVTIHEPAVGSGSMLIAVADHIEDLGYHPSISMWVEANDLSPLASKMAFLQLSWRGVPGVVNHANTISLEVHERYFTPAARFFLTHRGNPFLATTINPEAA